MLLFPNLKRIKTKQIQFDYTGFKLKKKHTKTLTHLMFYVTLYEYLINKKKYVLIEAASCQEYERKGADAEVQEHWAYVEQA
jgi:hypothetical protein